MPILYPEKLKQNDIIGVCAPSSGVLENFHDRFNNAIKNAYSTTASNY